MSSPIKVVRITVICKHCYYKSEITQLESDRTDFLDSKACAWFRILYCFQDISKSYGSQNLEKEFVCNQLISVCFSKKAYMQRVCNSKALFPWEWIPASQSLLVLNSGAHVSFQGLWDEIKRNLEISYLCLFSQRDLKICQFLGSSSRGVQLSLPSCSEQLLFLWLSFFLASFKNSFWP